LNSVVLIFPIELSGVYRRHKHSGVRLTTARVAHTDTTAVSQVLMVILYVAPFQKNFIIYRPGLNERVIKRLSYAI
jgi:hypothetical protein